MALLVDTTYRGIDVANAYVYVEPRSISLDKESMSFSISYKADPEQESFSSVRFSAPYSLDGENPFTQAYEYLKTLPEFQGCTEC